MKPIAQRTLGVSESQTFAIAAEIRKLREAGEDVISFSLGEPDFPSPECARDAAIEALKNNFTKYTANEGMGELRAAAAEKFRRENHLKNATAETVLVTCSGKQAIYNTLQAVCEAGDEVLLPAPYWVSYPEMIKLSGAQPAVIHTDETTGYRVTPDLLRAAITQRTKLIILNTPSNPTGLMYSEEELRALAAILAEKEIYIISDELYEKIVYDGNKHCSIGSFDETRDITITINGMSKGFSMTGWRIGFMHGRPDIVRAALKVQDQSTACPTSFAQKGALAALQHADADVKRMTATFQNRRNLIAGLLREIPGVRFTVPQGAFYLWLNVKQYLDRASMSIGDFIHYMLYTYKVGMVPGDAFGDGGFLRISYPCSDKDIIEGVARLKKGLAALPND